VAHCIEEDETVGEWTQTDWRGHTEDVDLGVEDPGVKKPKEEHEGKHARENNHIAVIVLAGPRDELARTGIERD